MHESLPGLVDNRHGSQPPQIRLILTPSSTCILLDVLAVKYHRGQPAPTLLRKGRVHYPEGQPADLSGLRYLAAVLREVAAILEA